MIKTKNLYDEFYRKPTEPRTVQIPTSVWALEEAEAIHHINPTILRKRKDAALTKHLESYEIKEKFLYLERPIDLDEVNKAIDSMEIRKSVGKDSITAEVIKQNREWLAPIIEIILQNCQQTNKLPRQWVKGVVTYIYKKKDPKEIKNYRPITLIAIIYKLWAIIWTKRLTHT